MILVTGGTGTLGRAILSLIVHSAVVISRDEEKQRVCADEFPRHAFCLCDVRDADALDAVFARFRPNAVIHLAALKQCPMGETNVMEHVKTNILGSENVVRACQRYGVSRAVLVSTDKACEPVSVYGASKLIAERLFTSAGYSVVRAGNIIGSRGSIASVLDEHDGPVPVTDPRMTRFYISRDRLAQFVFDVLFMSTGGLVHVPKMRSERLSDTVAGRECYIVGRRAGEKLHESAISRDEASSEWVGGGYVVGGDEIGEPYRWVAYTSGGGE